MVENINGKLAILVSKKRVLFGFMFIISSLLFSQNFNNFFTNDDFFLLKIAKANSISDFLNFFNITKGPDGLGMYRPLTTQVFYWVSRTFFESNPLPLHLIAFAALFGIVYLVYFLTKLLSKNSFVSATAAFLYATSATHFGHLYYMATFQELGMTFFVLLSVIFFIKFLT